MNEKNSFVYFKKISEQTYFDCFKKKFVSEEPNSILQDLSIPEIISLRQYTGKNRVNIIITLTTTCDLKCSYCFENGIIRESSTTSSLEKIVNAIDIFIFENSIAEADITLFGGEPMLEFNKLVKLCNDLNNISEKNNCQFSYLLSTNGIIGTEDQFTLLHELGVSCLQITFDGNEYINNKRRIINEKVHDQSKNAYISIMKNLKMLSSIFEQLSIKYNFDQVNKDYYTFFLEDLENAVGINKDKIIIALESIQDTQCNDYEYYFDNTDKLLSKTYIDLIKSSIKKGFRYNTKFFNTPCMHLSKNSFMLDTNGKIYSCISSFGINDFLVSSSTEDIVSSLDSFVEKNNNFSILEKHCEDCCYFPLCFGGCAYENYNKYGTIRDKVNCRKHAYDTFISEFYEEIFIKEGIEYIE